MKLSKRKAICNIFRFWNIKYKKIPSLDLRRYYCGAEGSGKRTTTNSKLVGALLGPKLGICQIFAEVRSLRHLCVEEEGLFIQIEEKHLLRKFMQEIFPFDIIVPRCGSMGAATVQELTIWPFVVWNIYGKKTPCCQVFHSSSGYDYCHHLCCYHYGQLVNVSAELNWHKRKAVPSS